MTAGRLVLDNSVMSAFRTAGWFSDVEFWHGEYRLYTSERVWESEFTQTFPDVTKPDWLHVDAVSVPDADERPVSLGAADWSLVVLARQLSDSILITNDLVLREQFEDEGGCVMWGTKFLLDTFEACGIGTDSFDTAVDEYVEDVHLPPAVAEEVRSAEKPPGERSR